MCFFAKSPPPPSPPPAPPIPSPPVRADEENKQRVDEELDLARKRRGSSGTIMTGGLGDPGFGTNIGVPTLGGAANRSINVGTKLG